MVADKKIDIQRLKESRPIVLDTYDQPFRIRHKTVLSFSIRPKTA